MCLLLLIKAQGRRGMTRAELREHIADYASCATDQAFERMLERDKSELREIGVVIDVVQRDPYHEDQAAYVLGAGSLLTMATHFDADELAILGMAAEAWERGTWSAAAHGALRKLEVLTDVFPLEPMTRISISTDALVQPLRSAIRSRLAISFTYRRPGDADPSLRHVEPWGLSFRHGGWYCVGFDLDRQAARVFRSSRFSSEVTTEGASTHPVDAHWPDLVRGDAVTPERIQATLLVLPDHGWTWRTQGQVRGERAVSGIQYDVLHADLADRGDLVGMLAAAAPEVLVVDPVELRSRVAGRIERVLHG